MNDEANLAEVIQPTESHSSPVQHSAPASSAPAVTAAQVDIAPKLLEWKNMPGDLQVMNTQAGALVRHKSGLTFIPECHVSEVGIFQLDTPEAPVRRLGRPKGSKNATKATKTIKAKRSPGRPKAKKIGRPKGSKNKVKRGPGRPKGSKNKK